MLLYSALTPTDAPEVCTASVRFGSLGFLGTPTSPTYICDLYTGHTGPHMRLYQGTIQAIWDEEQELTQ